MEPSRTGGPEDRSGALELRETPRHGFQGNRAPSPPPPDIPASITVALSRESGSRGGTIARRAGRKLGWQVYNQELLEYAAHGAPFQQGIEQSVTPAAGRWIDERLEVLRRQEGMSQHPSVIDLARMVLTLGAQGEVILIGRGAGCILPRASTLHVRIFAPRADRIAYMSQWMRLTREQAAEHVQLRDQQRAEFLIKHFQRQPGDIYQYDLLLNSSLLGEEMCAELIAEAVRKRLTSATREEEDKA